MSTEPAGLMQIWSARGIRAETLALDSKGTLHHAEATIAEPARAEGAEAAADGIEIGPVIGAGGMGVVRAGVQSALRRSVAVKELRPEHAHPGAVAGLLREAWVSGNLEHPNVVPVHALVPGDAGPRIVMKRVEGTEWAALIHRDPPDLARDLAILDKVCHAIHFAHARGVLHLDLKPHNVMIGSFGEVYVVDWGLAVAAGDDGPAWMPRASAITTVCGTPAYISPEAACGDGPGIDRRTDVYGLGAILHEILTRRGRHEGTTLVDTLVTAFASEPFGYGPDVPRELAAIANRATARDPDDRYEDAEALRQALADFVTHRSASQLTDDAQRRLDRLVGLTSDRPQSGRSTVDEALVERLQTECRVAFEQALALWPESPEARAGKRRLAEVRVEHALAMRDARRASAALRELDLPSPALAARVEALRAEAAQASARVEHLERLGHESDIDVNRLVRSRMAAICGLMWLGWNLGSAFVVKTLGLELVWWHLFASAGATIALCVAAIAIYGRRVATTAVNRAILGLFASFFGVVVLFWSGAWALGLGPLQAIGATNAIYLCYALALAFFVDRRALGPALVIAPATPLGMAFPELAFEIAALVGATLSLWLAWVWRRPATNGTDGEVRGLAWTMDRPRDPKEG